MILRKKIHVNIYIHTHLTIHVYIPVCACVCIYILMTQLTLSNLVDAAALPAPTLYKSR